MRKDNPLEYDLQDHPQNRINDFLRTLCFRFLLDGWIYWSAKEVRMSIVLFRQLIGVTGRAWVVVGFQRDTALQKSNDGRGNIRWTAGPLVSKQDWANLLSGHSEESDAKE